MNWRLLLKILVAGGFLTFVAGALLIVFTQRQRDYRNLVDTHDLKIRVSTMGDAYIRERTEAALVIGVVQGGKTHVTGFGHPGTNGAPDGQTIFEIGALTKVFTGVTLARMVVANQLNLDDPISRSLPREAVCPQYNHREITLKDLASHSAGLPRLPDNLADTIRDMADPYANYHPADLYHGVSLVRLAHEPGTRSSYSDFGFAVLGQILSLKSGKSYEALVSQSVCQPLGLNDTLGELSTDQRLRLTPGHGPKGEPAAPWHCDTFAGSLGLHSTANDLLKFIQANFGPIDSELARALDLARQVQFRAFIGSVGLGWQIREPAPDTILYWHNGGTGGFVSFIGFDRAAQVGVVLLSSHADALVRDSTLDKMGMDLLKFAHKVSWD